MPEPIHSNVQEIDWRILVDVNVDEGVDQFFVDAGASVYSAKAIFAKGTPDDEVDTFAQKHGCIIVSPDRQFMKLIQRRCINAMFPRQLDMAASCCADLRSGKRDAFARFCQFWRSTDNGRSCPIAALSSLLATTGYGSMTNRLHA